MSDDLAADAATAGLHDYIKRLEDRLRACRGGCKILSQGDACDCGLCKREREIERLRGENDELRKDRDNYMQVIKDHRNTICAAQLAGDALESQLWELAESERNCRRLLREAATRLESEPTWIFTDECTDWILTAMAGGDDGN